MSVFRFPPGEAPPDPVGPNVLRVTVADGMTHDVFLPHDGPYTESDARDALRGTLYVRDWYDSAERFEVGGVVRAVVTDAVGNRWELEARGAPVTEFVWDVRNSSGGCER